MFTRFPVAASATAGPTSLLTLLAGDFAPRVAALWPDPHGGFLAAPAARRHLVCLALALGRDVRSFAERLLTARLRVAIRLAVEAPPAGLERLLGRAGEIAWDVDAYRALIRLLERAAPAKVLRHAETVDAALVRRLAGLPDAMAPAARLAAALSPEGVEVLREAYQALALRDGQAAADVAATGWGRAATTKALFERVRDDLTPEPMAPPHPGTARLRPLASKAALKDASRRYRNCLTDRGSDAATGWAAFYEWLGQPGAIVAITRDHVFGWRMDEARVARNAAVPEALREEIISELALMGVHVGRSGWSIDRLLRDDVGRDYRYWPVADDVAEAFGAD
ncbi:hypothetical protein [Phenylobacterium sp.]|uniref:hypothetical protein n=1 Tax=Phenylobacterium sp. TaxID=1871053 RepID=UPI002ED9F3DE